MKLPTNEEISRAGKEYGQSEPQPMAARIDHNSELSAAIEMYVGMHSAGFSIRDALKAAMVTGLHYGMRIEFDVVGTIREMLRETQHSQERTLAYLRRQD